MLISVNYPVQRLLKTSLSFFKHVQLISAGHDLILVYMFSPFSSLWTEISPYAFRDTIAFSVLVNHTTYVIESAKNVHQ